MPKHTWNAGIGAVVLVLVACSGVTKEPTVGDLERSCHSYTLPNNPDVNPPRLVHSEQPEMPASGPRNGYVCVRATVNSSGTLVGPTVVQTDSQEFAQAFLRTLPNWRYEPATRGSARVPYHITLFARFPPG